MVFGDRPVLRDGGNSEAFCDIAVGVGLFIALFLTTYTKMNPDVVYPATIITMSGIGLLVGFHKAKDLDK